MDNPVTQEQEVIKRARDEIEKRTGKTPEQLYAEREKRVTDTMQLRIPDRMPVYLRGGFAAKYAGIPESAAFYDPVATRDAYIKMVLDFEPDFGGIGGVGRGRRGSILDKLGPRQYRWPGGNLRPDEGPQWVEMEIMKENEYDLFISDPSDFILRYYLPRTWKALEPFAKLPPLHSLVSPMLGVATQAPRFSTPEMIKAFETIFEAGQDQAVAETGRIDLGRALGVPPLLNTRAGDAVAPFDFIGDYFRGMRGIAVDMFKQPEKLQKAMERVLEYFIARAIPYDSTKYSGPRTYGGMSHWCAEDFLTKKQFETYFWPTNKKSMLNQIELGWTPLPHPEGNMTDRIECFLDMPKGKMVLWNEVLDVVRAKEILGGHICFMGGVPASLMWGGSPKDVDEHCKKIIKICGKGGGFILSCAGGEKDAKPENVKAMVDAVKKYGQY